MPEAGEQHLPDCRVHERGPEGLRTDRWGHVPPVCISPSCRCGLQTLLDRRCSKRPFNECAGFWGKTFKHVQIREHEQPIIQTWTIQVPKGTLETGRQAPPGGKRIRWPKGVRWRRRWHPTPVLLSGKSHGWRGLVGCGPWSRTESDTTERLHFHFPALEKEIATHSSVLAWRIQGMGEPGGLPSMGSHRVGHN